MRRNHSIAVSINGFTVIMATVFGLTHIIYGSRSLEAIEILMGVLIATLVRRRFRDTIPP